MRNSKCILMFYILCVGLFFSCGNKVQEKKLFDIPGYFKMEIDSIKTHFTKVEKISVYNRDTVQTILKVAEINWEKEFAIFLESDINKPVYYANMKVDDNGNCWTDSKKLSIQKVDLGYGMNEEGFSNYRVEHVSIQISKTNLISNTSIDAEYHSENFYRIRGIQTIKQLGDKNEFWVEGKFYK